MCKNRKKLSQNKNVQIQKCTNRKNPAQKIRDKQEDLDNICTHNVVDVIAVPLQVLDYQALQEVRVLQCTILAGQDCTMSGNQWMNLTHCFTVENKHSLNLSGALWKRLSPIGNNCIRASHFKNIWKLFFCSHNWAGKTCE